MAEARQPCLVCAAPWLCLAWRAAWAWVVGGGAAGGGVCLVGLTTANSPAPPRPAHGPAPPPRDVTRLPRAAQPAAAAAPPQN